MDERTYRATDFPGQGSDLGVPWIYEFVAVRSKRLPTITDLVKSLPLVAHVVL
jgi:hypothetical protein